MEKVDRSVIDVNETSPEKRIAMMQAMRLRLLVAPDSIDKTEIKLIKDIVDCDLSQLRLDADAGNSESMKELAAAIASTIGRQGEDPFRVTDASKIKDIEGPVVSDTALPEVKIEEWSTVKELGSPSYDVVMGNEVKE